MYLVKVKFNGKGKTYHYYSKIKLVVGETYNIVADGVTKYTSPVKVTDILSDCAYFNCYRTITAAEWINNKPRPKDGLNKVIFDEEAGVTVALWCDGTKTIVRCQEGDTFDKEKAVALCYMKKVLGNRGSFNETLKKWTK